MKYVIARLFGFKDRLFLLGLVFLSLGPVVFLVIQEPILSEADGETWSFIVNNILPEVVWNTFVLLILVVCGSLSLGILQAFLIVYTNVPGKQFFKVLFVLPLSFPLYCLAFIYVGMFELHTSFFNIKSVWGVAAVFTLALSPYVYLLSVKAFETAGLKMIMLGRTLGLGPGKIFLKTILPYARPWFFVGAGIVAMETLADFGGVSVFNYDTFTVAIYHSWNSLFSLATASRLSIALMIFALMFFWFESRSHSKRNFFSMKNKIKENLTLFSFNPLGKWGIFLTCSAIVFLSTVLPIYQLLRWAFYSLTNNGWDEELMGILNNTVAIGLIGACILLLLGLGVAVVSQKKHRWIQELKNMALVGYAFPGTLIAVATFSLFSYIQGFFNISYLGIGSLGILFCGYIIRFINVSSRPLETALKSTHQSMGEVARSLGVCRLKTFLQVHFPLMWGTSLSVLLISFLEIIKEMPMTLMLRPYNINMLAVKIYGLTSEGEWERASLASLLLIAVGMISIFIHMKSDGARS